MQHLDDGVLHALVDGEVASADLPPIRTHLESCADCAARLEAARLLAGEADQLVDVVEFPGRGGTPAVTAARPARSGRLGRRLAWAASVALAASLGYAGGRGNTRQLAAPTDVAMAPVNTAPSATEPLFSEQPQVQAAPIPASQPPAPSGSPGAAAARARELPAPSGNEPAPMAQRAAAENEAAVAQDLAAPGAVGGVSAPAAAGRVAADEKAAESKMAFRREAAPAPRQVAPEYGDVSLEEAVRRLGGPLRQVDGLVPVRLEAAGPVVRLVYRLADGELVLEQRREGDSVVVRLIAPGLSPDSLAKLRVRE
jgi:hypothetical protein